MNEVVELNLPEVVLLAKPGRMKLSPSRRLYVVNPKSVFVRRSRTASVSGSRMKESSLTGAQVYELVLYVWLAPTIRLALRMVWTSVLFRHANVSIFLLQPVSDTS